MTATRLSSRRAERRSGGNTGLPTQLPWRSLVNPYRPIEVLSADQVEFIHESSLDVLENLGVDFWSAESLDRLAKAGMKVDRANQHVHFDRHWVLEQVAKAPSEFVITPRNPERAVTMGGNHINFGGVGGPPNCSDLDGGRRPGTFKDFRELVKLEQSINALHLIGGTPVASIDLAPEIRHLDVYLSFITLTDKVWSPSAIGGERINDGIDMMCIAAGVDRATMAKKPMLIGNINTNSPLRVDGAMLDGATAMVEARQPLIVTPFTLAGAMSPVSLAGALTQQNAEALSVIAYLQYIAPGAPVVYGGFTSNVDMKSGAPAFGTPEYSRATLAGGQMARRYKLPYRSSNTNASNMVDAQAAYESQMSLWAAVMGHANMVYHATGWLEGGLVASYEKMVVDAEMLQMMAEFLQPIKVDRESVAMDAMAEVGPGGHFFGAAHTMARYETAFYRPMISDWRNFQSWQEAGSRSATDRAHTIHKALLANYQPPPLDPARVEALEAFVARRKGEIAKAA
ncbi:MAG: trimethylamine methyltransferase family protein [Alphaproteobacteria bacterium]|nr:trimethylamine methyltransferase family protein [Alphaproteobacteria bacterium]